jgi:HSP20 family molecular chaperone IbpA
MSNVAIQKVDDQAPKTQPVFAEIGKRLEGVRRRAFELFERRGCELGHAVEDWLKAEHEVFGWPAAEMAEKDKEYELQLALPGFDAKELQVTVSPLEVIVHAETKSEKKSEEPSVIWTEFSSNDVYRRFEMPQPIDVEKTRAILDKGILRITAPKTGAAEQKPIAVAAA